MNMSSASVRGELELLQDLVAQLLLATCSAREFSLFSRKRNGDPVVVDGLGRDVIGT